MKAFVLALIRLYQLFGRAALAPCCRFHPSCSDFARQAISEQGLRRGAGLAAWRLLRCHPLHPGGWDPVPPRIPLHG